MVKSIISCVILILATAFVGVSIYAKGVQGLIASLDGLLQKDQQPTSYGEDIVQKRSNSVFSGTTGILQTLTFNASCFVSDIGLSALLKSKGFSFDNVSHAFVCKIFGIGIEA